MRDWPCGGGAAPAVGNLDCSRRASVRLREARFLRLRASRFACLSRRTACTPWTSAGVCSHGPHGHDLLQVPRLLLVPGLLLLLDHPSWGHRRLFPLQVIQPQPAHIGSDEFLEPQQTASCKTNRVLQPLCCASCRKLQARLCACASWL